MSVNDHSGYNGNLSSVRFQHVSSVFSSIRPRPPPPPPPPSFPPLCLNVKSNLAIWFWNIGLLQYVPDNIFLIRTVKTHVTENNNTIVTLLKVVIEVTDSFSKHTHACTHSLFLCLHPPPPPPTHTQTHSLPLLLTNTEHITPERSYKRVLRFITSSHQVCRSVFSAANLAVSRWTGGNKSVYSVVSSLWSSCGCQPLKVKQGWLSHSVQAKVVEVPHSLPSCLLDQTKLWSSFSVMKFRSSTSQHLLKSDHSAEESFKTDLK